MPIQNITRVNTVDEWRIQTNQSANAVNQLETGNFNKTAGTLTVSGTGAISITAEGTPLSVSNTALFSSNITVGRNISLGSEGSATGNLTVGANVFIYGRGTALFVANNATVNNNLQVTQTITTNNITTNTNVTVSGTTQSGNLIVDRIAVIVGNTTVGNLTSSNATSTGSIRVNDVTETTSNTTGAAFVAGGVGIAKSLYVSGNVTIKGDSQNSTSNGVSLTIGDKTANSAGNLYINAANTENGGANGSLTVQGNGTITGNLSVGSGQGSISTTTGAFKVSGGVGVTGNAYVGGATYSPEIYDNSIRVFTSVSNTSPISATKSGVTLTVSHETSGVVNATHGSEISVPVFVVNPTGHITSVTNTAIRVTSVSQTGVVQLDDTEGSVSITKAATPNSVITNIATANTKLKNYVDVANTNMKNYVDVANTNMKNYVDVANTNMKNLVDSNVNALYANTGLLRIDTITANNNMKNYVDVANTNMKNYVDVANSNMKNLVDSNVSSLYANTGLLRIDTITANNNMKNYVDVANTNLKNYTDSTFLKLTSGSPQTITSTLIVAGPTTLQSGTVTGAFSVQGDFTVLGQQLVDTNRIKLMATTKQSPGTGYDYFTINRVNAAATLDGTTDIVTLSDHGFVTGQNVRLTSVSTNVTILANNVNYRVTVINSSTFKLSTSAGYPTLIDFGTTGTGTALVTDLDNADADIRWDEANENWQLRDTNNLNDATAYSKILTANLISDSISLDSSDNLASSKALRTGVLSGQANTGAARLELLANVGAARIADVASGQANVGAGLITVTGAYQANVGAARIADTLARQANVGAGDIAVTNAYQANVGAARIADVAAGQANAGIALITAQANTGAARLELLANVGAARIADVAAGQANVGAGLISVTSAYQANVGAGLISARNTSEANVGAGLITKLDKTGGTITGSLTITQDLVVSGTTTTINTNELNVADNEIVLNSDWPLNTMPTQNAGITIHRGSIANSPNVYIRYDETNDYWVLRDNLAQHIIATHANVGAGLISVTNTVTNAYQANVGAARIADVASGQANVGAGLISVTSAYQANVGAGLIATKNTSEANVGAGLISARNTSEANVGAGLISARNTSEANVGAGLITKVNKAGDTMTGALVITDSTAATSTTTGAIRVTGGISSQTNVWAANVVSSGPVYGATGVFDSGIRVIRTLVNNSPINATTTGGSVSISHASSGVVAATHGSASQVPRFVVDVTGHIISVTNTNISISSSAVSGLAPSATIDTTNASNITTGNLTVDRLPYTMNQGVATSSYVHFQAIDVGTGSYTASAGQINAAAEITSYYSDERLKDKLGNIENALDKVKQLSGFFYKANQTAQDLGFTDERKVGVSAQEVQKVLPEVIAPAPIDPQYMTVHYERLVPLLIEAIKELDAKLEQLKNK